MKNNNIKVCLSSKSNDWATPKELFNSLNKEFNFNFDPCPLNSDFNGLVIDWKERNFINPPYSTKDQNAFLKKGYEEFLKGRLKFGGASNSAPFDSAIIIFDPNFKKN